MGWRAQLGTVEGALDAQGFQIYSSNQFQAVEAKRKEEGPLTLKRTGSSHFRAFFPVNSLTSYFSQPGCLRHTAQCERAEEAEFEPQAILT